MALFQQFDQRKDRIFDLIQDQGRESRDNEDDGMISLIVGLGNIGKEYDLTRHNIGFFCVDTLVEAENGSWSEKKTLKSQISDLKIGSTRLILCKPTTYMNLSGEAVQAVQKYFKISNSKTIVVHDE